jgi:hypothetical protein
MRKKIIPAMLAALLALAALAGCGAKEPGVSAIDWANHDVRAVQFVTALVNGDYTIAAQGFDAAMQRALSVRALRKAWEDMVKQAGAFAAIEETERIPDDEYDIYHVLTRHEKSGVNTRVVFSADGLVAGLFFTFVPNPDRS